MKQILPAGLLLQQFNKYPQQYISYYTNNTKEALATVLLHDHPGILLWFIEKGLLAVEDTTIAILTQGNAVEIVKYLYENKKITTEDLTEATVKKVELPVSMQVVPTSKIEAAIDSREAAMEKLLIRELHTAVLENQNIQEVKEVQKQMKEEVENFHQQKEPVDVENSQKIEIKPILDMASGGVEILEETLNQTIEFYYSNPAIDAGQLIDAFRTYLQENAKPGINIPYIFTHGDFQLQNNYADTALNYLTKEISIYKQIINNLSTYNGLFISEQEYYAFINEAKQKFNKMSYNTNDIEGYKQEEEIAAVVEENSNLNTKDFLELVSTSINVVNKTLDQISALYNNNLTIDPVQLRDSFNEYIKENINDGVVIPEFIDAFKNHFNVEDINGTLDSLKKELKIHQQAIEELSISNNSTLSKEEYIEIVANIREKANNAMTESSVKEPFVTENINTPHDGNDTQKGIKEESDSIVTPITKKEFIKSIEGILKMLEEYRDGISKLLVNHSNLNLPQIIEDLKSELQDTFNINETEKQWFNGQMLSLIDELLYKINTTSRMKTVDSLSIKLDSATYALNGMLEEFSDEAPVTYDFFDRFNTLFQEAYQARSVREESNPVVADKGIDTNLGEPTVQPEIESNDDIIKVDRDSITTKFNGDITKVDRDSITTELSAGITESGPDVNVVTNLEDKPETMEDDAEVNGSDIDPEGKSVTEVPAGKGAPEKAVFTPQGEPTVQSEPSQLLSYVQTDDAGNDHIMRVPAGEGITTITSPLQSAEKRVGLLGDGVKNAKEVIDTMKVGAKEAVNIAKGWWHNIKDMAKEAIPSQEPQENSKPNEPQQHDLDYTPNEDSLVKPLGDSNHKGTDEMLFVTT